MRRQLITISSLVMLLTSCGAGNSQSDEKSQLQFNYTEIDVPVNNQTTVQASYFTNKDTIVTFMISDTSIVNVTPQYCLFNIESHQCNLTVQASNKLESTYLIESGAPSNTSQILVKVFRWANNGGPLFNESRVIMSVGESKVLSAKIVNNYPSSFLPTNFIFTRSNESSITMSPMNCDFKDNNNLCYFTFYALESGITYISESNIANPVNFVEVHVN